MSIPIARVLIFSGVIIGVFTFPTVASAQADLRQLPFTDPQRMFDQFFGEDSDADRETLRKIEVSAEDERRFGEQMLKSGLAAWKQEKIKVVSKGRDVDYLQSLVATLQPFMTNRDRYQDIRVLVAKSPRCDARSCPGGTLVFFDGLLDAAGSEAALIGVVGHELSHLDRGHQLLPLKRIQLMEQHFTKGFDPDQFFKSGPWMTKLMSRPFRPEDERDADADGAAWAFAAGYDPREMAQLFLRQAEKKKQPNEPADGWPTFFRSHPYDKERHQTILQQYVDLQKQHPQQELFIGRENLKSRKSRKQEEDEE